jgi:hypothetical protein
MTAASIPEDAVLSVPFTEAMALVLSEKGVKVTVLVVIVLVEDVIDEVVEVVVVVVVDVAEVVLVTVDEVAVAVDVVRVIDVVVDVVVVAVVDVIVVTVTVDILVEVADVEDVVVFVNVVVVDVGVVVVVVLVPQCSGKFGVIIPVKSGLYPLRTVNGALTARSSAVYVSVPSYAGGSVGDPEKNLTCGLFGIIVLAT